MLPEAATCSHILMMPQIVLLFKCKWNFDAGLGVKLVNEDIVKVGIQSEVLI